MKKRPKAPTEPTKTLAEALSALRPDMPDDAPERRDVDIACYVAGIYELMARKDNELMEMLQTAAGARKSNIELARLLKVSSGTFRYRLSMDAWKALATTPSHDERQAIIKRAYRDIEKRSAQEEAKRQSEEAARKTTAERELATRRAEEKRREIEDREREALDRRFKEATIRLAGSTAEKGAEKSNQAIAMREKAFTKMIANGITREQCRKIVLAMVTLGATSKGTAKRESAILKEAKTKTRITSAFTHREGLAKNYADFRKRYICNVSRMGYWFDFG